MKIRILEACCLISLLIAVTAAQGNSTSPTSNSDSSSSTDASNNTVSSSPIDSSSTTNPDTNSSSSPTDSSSTTIPVTGPDSSPTGSSSTIITTPTSTSTSTAKPSLPKEEVLQQTNLALENITSSINTFLEELALVTTEAPSTTQETTTAANPAMEFFKKEQRLLMAAMVHAADLSSICNTSYIRCVEFLVPLNSIQGSLLQIMTETDTWQESDLDKLKRRSDNLASQVAEKTEDNEFMTVIIYKAAAEAELNKFVTDIQEASTAVDNAITNLNSNNDGVIFVAVFGSVGGLIVLALIIGLIVTCAKSKKAKKGKKSKKYSKVPEERVPVEGFKRGLDNDAYHDEERGHSQHDSYPMRNVSSKRPAPNPTKGDPHARAPGGRYEEPYPPASKPKSIADYYAKPGTSGADDYYSRPGSARDDGHHARQGPSRPEDPYARQGNSKPEDPYARPAKGPSQGGLNRYYY